MFKGFAANIDTKELNYAVQACCEYFPKPYLTTRNAWSATGTSP